MQIKLSYIEMFQAWANIINKALEVATKRHYNLIQCFFSSLNKGCPSDAMRLRKKHV